MKIIQIERGVMANAYEVRRLLKTKDGEGREFCGVDLHDADLAGAELSGIKLTDADLHGACLRGACLRGADLTRANLSGADLRGADLSGSLLADADLFCADLRGADLSSAVLRGALLRMTDLEGITVDDFTVTPEGEYVGDLPEDEEEAGYWFDETNYYENGRVEGTMGFVVNDGDEDDDEEDVEGFSIGISIGGSFDCDDEHDEGNASRLDGTDYRVRHCEDEDGYPCEEETWYKGGELIRKRVKYL